MIGEAEDVIKEFVAAWERGERSGVFTAEKFQVDVTKTPMPRFDLLKFDHYLYICIQYSRGCPFTCEFCDIIELYGRVPRTKTNDQILAELQRLYDLGYRGHVDFVDDNLIGNKKSLRTSCPCSRRGKSPTTIRSSSRPKPPSTSPMTTSCWACSRTPTSGWSLSASRARPRDAGADAQEAEHQAQPRRMRAQDLQLRHRRHRRIHRRLRHREGLDREFDGGIHRRLRGAGRDGRPALRAAGYAAHAAASRRKAA